MQESNLQPSDARSLGTDPILAHFTTKYANEMTVFASDNRDRGEAQTPR